MSYIQKSLGDGEAIIARARFPKLYFLAAWLMLLVPLVLLPATLVRAQTQPDPYSVAAGLLLALGLIQFLTPTGQYLVATVAYHEPVSTGALWSFALIWAGVLVFCADLWRRSR